MINNKKKTIMLLVAFIILLVSIVFVLAGAKKVEVPYYDYEKKAELRMRDYMKRIMQYKKDLHIEKGDIIYYDEAKTKIDEERSYIIGDEFTEITTTVGDIAAKRTASHDKSAALMVSILYKNGVRPGDTVAAQMTGSFLGYDLALLSACEEMNVKLAYMVSFGSSMYGANQTKLTFPDMLIKLIDDGVVTNEPLAISIGGDFDIGEEMEPIVRDEVKERLMKSKYDFIYERDFSKNVDYRMKLYDKYDFDFFIAVGGNVTSLGMGEKGDKKGLLQIYKEKGKKTMQMINIKKLVYDYGMDFDTPTLSETKDSIYYEKKYNVLVAIVGIIISILILLYGEGKIDMKKIYKKGNVSLLLLLCLLSSACSKGSAEKVVEKTYTSGNDSVKVYEIVEGEMREDNYKNWTLKNFSEYFKNKYETKKTTYKILEGTAYENEVVKLEGKEKGKTIYCVCSVHGDERAAFVAGNIMKDACIEKGTVYILSPANIYGSIYNTRETQNGLNINRSFPGDGEGDAYEIAKAIYEDIKDKKPDIVMDLHEGYKHYPGYDNLGNSIIVNDYDMVADLAFGILSHSDKKELYKKYDANFTYYATPPEGSVNKVISETLNIPVITVETNREEPLKNRVEKQIDIVEYVINNQDLY